MATANKGGAKSASKGATKTAATVSKTLTVEVARNAKLTSITTQLKKALGRAGCEGCRSGFDRITFKDPVIRTVK